MNPAAAGRPRPPRSRLGRIAMLRRRKRAKLRHRTFSRLVPTSSACQVDRAVQNEAEPEAQRDHAERDEVLVERKSGAQHERQQDEDQSDDRDGASGAEVAGRGWSGRWNQARMTTSPAPPR